MYVETFSLRFFKCICLAQAAQSFFRVYEKTARRVVFLWCG